MNVVLNLFLSMFAAAGVGFVIGWFARRIHSIHEHNHTVTEAETKIATLTRKLRTSLSDNARLSENLQETRATLNAHEKSSKQSGSMSNGALVDLKRRDQRIVELEAQVHAAEEQNIRMQRDVAQLQLRKAREIEQLRSNQAPPRAEDNLPVLNKKATAAAPGVVAAATSKPAVDIAPPRFNQKNEIPEIASEFRDVDEDVLEMTSEFNFDSSALLSDDIDLDGTGR